jgi:dinuclear metal center YbgI/SA1388 family protein
VACQLKEIVDYLDQYLRTSQVPDDPRALNGLQVENSGSISRILAAVDACKATIDLASAGDLMVVHHGLFWSGLVPITGPRGRRIRALISRDIALYSSHLPLDCHPDVGNNFLLARRLGVVNLEPFGEAAGARVGVAGDISLSRADLAARLEAKLGVAPKVIGAGPDRVRRIGIVTGAGSSDLGEAAAVGLDTFVTGEGPHHTFLEAEELGINLIYAGHYATETLGVQALAGHLSEKFGVPWQFVDHPTGL